LDITAIQIHLKIYTLAEHKIVKLRLYTTDGYIDRDINLNRSLVFQESAKLILQQY